MIRFLSTVLMLSAVALGVFLAKGWDSTYRPAASVAGQQDTAGRPTPSQVLGSADFQLPPQSAFDEFIDRPLFNADRRPHAPPAEETRDAEPVARQTKRRRTRAGVILTGVIIDGEERFALLREQRGGAVSLLRAGGSVDGWRVVEIYPDSVTLNDGSVTEELPLRTFEAPPSPPKKTAKAEEESTDEEVAASTTENSTE